MNFRDKLNGIPHDVHVDGLVPFVEGPVPTDPLAYDDTDPYGERAARSTIAEEEKTLDLEYNVPTVEATDAETLNSYWHPREYVPPGARKVLAQRAYVLKYVSGFRWKEVGDRLGINPRLATELAAEHNPEVFTDIDG